MDRARLREHMFQGHTDLFAECEEYLLGRFRSPRTSFMEICNTLQPALQSQATNSNSKPPHIQVLSTLDFLANGWKK